MKPEDIDMLLDGYLHGTLTVVEVEKVWDLLRADPTLASRLVQMSMVEPMLMRLGRQGIPIQDESVDAIPTDTTPVQIPAGSRDPSMVEEIKTKADRQLQRFLKEQAQLQQTQHNPSRPPLNFRPFFDRMTKKARTVVSLTWKTTKGMGIAAVILLVTLLSIQAYRMNRVVAVVGGQVESQWLDMSDSNSLKPGLLVLEKGYAELRFTQGAEVVVEAPCEFELLTPNRMRVISGRVTANVPPEAHGFRIDTIEGAVVDLGTEFGVGVTSQLDVYVFEGEVELSAIQSGVRPASRQSFKAGQAVTLAAGKLPVVNSLTDRALMFVRELPGPNDIPGVPRCYLDLADFVGGGDGFGSGTLECGVDMGTGQWRHPIDYDNDRQAQRAYVLAPEIKAIDGVFVPDGGAGAVQVTSEGHVFTDCPDTSGLYWSQVANSSRIRVLDESTSQYQYHHAVIDGVEYGTGTHPSLLMHANVGITFDLHKIRAGLPEHVDIVGFESLCGISSTTLQEDGADDGRFSDLWVLVDGQTQFEAREQKATMEAKRVSLLLTANSRFLTLIVTDGDMGTGLDWCLFAEPRLLLEKR